MTRVDKHVVEMLGTALAWLDPDSLRDCQLDPRLEGERDQWIARARRMIEGAESTGRKDTE